MHVHVITHWHHQQGNHPRQVLIDLLGAGDSLVKLSIVRALRLVPWSTRGGQLDVTFFWGTKSVGWESVAKF